MQRLALLFLFLIPQFCFYAGLHARQYEAVPMARRWEHLVHCVVELVRVAVEIVYLYEFLLISELAVLHVDSVGEVVQTRVRVVASVLALAQVLGVALRESVAIILPGARLCHGAVATLAVILHQQIPFYWPIAFSNQVNRFSIHMLRRLYPSKLQYSGSQVHVQDWG